MENEDKVETGALGAGDGNANVAQGAGQQMTDEQKAAQIPADPPRDAPSAPQAEAFTAPELGDTVDYFERNFDPVTSEPQDGYQTVKNATVVLVTDASRTLDVRVTDGEGLGLISHNVLHKSEATDGQNYWDFTEA